MSGGAAVLPWIFAALLLGFGVAWFVFARTGRGSGDQKEMIRSLFAEEGRSARQELRDNIDANTRQMLDRIESIRRSGDEKVDKIRETVDENLNKSMTSSFEQIGKLLDTVHKDLGGVEDLKQQVRNLKDILGNVRVRGLHAEAQLEALLDEVLVPGQFRKNVNLGEGRQIVEFALCLPNSESAADPLYLPLDSKCPLDAYEKLQNAEQGTEAASPVKEARREFGNRLKTHAKSIRKYIAPPATTNFALMYLPYEGMYAEALRDNDTWMEIRRSHHVVVVGPTTLFALLQSLQLGFESLSISKRSTEVWAVLREIKSEFLKFESVIEALGKQIDTARGTVDKAETRTRQMKKRLDGVSAEDRQEHGNDSDSPPV